MNPDDPVCLCFHVSRRKVVSFIRVEKPKRPSQLSNCFGAGTGCGWCRPYLERLLSQHLAGQKNEGQKQSFASPIANPADSVEPNEHQNSPTEFQEPTLEQYKQARSKYVRQGGGSPPPGATPIDQ